MLFAYIAYKGQFTGRVSALINYAVEIKMLSLHSERLSDIALSEPETDNVPPNDLAHLEPSIALRNVNFRYGEGEPWVLGDLNLQLPTGQSVALVTDALAAMPMTRIIVAHRPETIAGAQRVVGVDEGKAVELRGRL